EPEKNLFQILQVIGTRKWYSDIYYDRLAQILDSMQLKQKEVVSRTLQKITNNDYDVLLKLIKRIKNIEDFGKTDEDFGKIDWIKIILDNAEKSEVKVNAYQWLVD